MPRLVGDFRGLTQPNRLRLLRALQRRPGQRVDELAEECGIPVNTVRDHLHVLEEEGLIRSETVRTQTRGRPPVVFHPVGADALPEPVRARIAQARTRGALLRAVTGAGSTTVEESVHDQLDVLYEHLDDTGFEPVIDEESLTVELTPCRFQSLIDADAGLVCSVHARLVGDVLSQVDGPLFVQRIEPFVTPHSCRIALGRAASASSPQPAPE